MFLRNLIIESNQGIIREIEFQEGLNLIVDETDTENFRESGNNVGKTTVLRLVDFCFDGNGKNIYKDPEFNNEKNEEIKQFLEEEEIKITLILSSDFTDFPPKKLKISRNFLSYSDKILEINDEQVPTSEFQDRLKEVLFNLTANKPTLRQIVAKHIRDESNKLTNAIKVLHVNTTLEEYEALYFFWLGIDNNKADRKIRLGKRKTKETDHRRRLTRDRSKSEIEQTIKVLEREIEHLQEQRESFNLNPKYEEELDELNNVKKEIREKSQLLTQIEVKIDLINDSKENLENEFSEINVNQLKSLYNETNSVIDEISKRFEDLLDFHNSLLKDRIEFITDELPELQETESILDFELFSLLEREKELTLKLNKTGAFDELEEIVLSLNEKHELKGSFENQLEQINESIAQLRTIESELADIEKGIDDLEEQISEKIAIFNKYFIELSEELYDEQFILVSERTERAYKLEISTLSGNPGTGKKKGVIVAFDMAHMRFCEELDIDFLRFVMYDQLENVHGNQLRFLDKIAKESNAQIITAILRDKLPEELQTGQFEILTLSESDKLFKV